MVVVVLGMKIRWFVVVLIYVVSVLWVLWSKVVECCDRNLIGLCFIVCC